MLHDNIELCQEICRSVGTHCEMCISTLDKQFEHLIKNIIHYLFEIFSVFYSTFICALWKCAIFLLKSIGFLNRGSVLARCVDELDSSFILFYSTDARVYIHP